MEPICESRSRPRIPPLCFHAQPWRCARFDSGPLKIDEIAALGVVLGNDRQHSSSLPQNGWAPSTTMPTLTPQVIVAIFLLAFGTLAVAFPSRFAAVWVRGRTDGSTPTAARRSGVVSSFSG